MKLSFWPFRARTTDPAPSLSYVYQELGPEPGWEVVESHMTNVETGEELPVTWFYLDGGA